MVVGTALALAFAGALSAAPGDLDPTFGTGGRVLTDFEGGSNEHAFSVAVQPDGKIVAAGEIVSATEASFALARYARNGALDPTFDGDGKVRTKFTPSSNEEAYSVAVQSDGKIVAAGVVGIPGNGTASDFALARYNADGTLDTSFDGDGKVVTDFAGGSDWSFSVAVQSDGKIVVAGASRVPGGPSLFDFAVARYNADGSLDGSFDGDGKVVTPIADGSNDFVNAMAVQPDGKIVAGGQSEARSVFSASLARYLPNGALDSSFDGDGTVNLTNPTYSIYDLALQRDGKIVTAALPLVSASLFNVSRFNADGSVDTTFDGDGNAGVTFRGGATAVAVAVQADGKIVAAGPVGYPASDFALARFDKRGAIDDAFGEFGMVTTDVGGPGSRDYVSDLAVAPDGKLVVTGYSGPESGSGPDDFAVVRYVGTPPPCKVPNVRGKKLARARASIRRARCRVGKITRKPSKPAKKGRVLSQRPKAGTTLPNAAKVNLVVGKGRRR